MMRMGRLKFRLRVVLSISSLLKKERPDETHSLTESLSNSANAIQEETRKKRAYPTVGRQSPRSSGNEKGCCIPNKSVHDTTAIVLVFIDL